MSVAENKIIVRNFWQEIWNKANFDAADDLVAPNFLLYLPANPEPLQGSEGLKQWANTVYTAFPDMHYQIEDEIAEGNTVVTRWKFSGTHKGAFQVIPPSGKQVTMMGISIFRIADSKITEDRAAEDTLGLLQQIGAIPSPGQPQNH